jgi:hypothetical protein
MRGVEMACLSTAPAPLVVVCLHVWSRLEHVGKKREFGDLRRGHIRCSAIGCCFAGAAVEQREDCRIGAAENARVQEEIMRAGR